jgi:hypothetical protein
MVPAIRLLLASGFLAAVAHVVPVAERAALGITRVEDLAPEAIARPLGKLMAALLSSVDMSSDLGLSGVCSQSMEIAHKSPAQTIRTNKVPIQSRGPVSISKAHSSKGVEFLR